ncbi:hypothetical protein KW460_19290 [Vibrio fluvialis]|uniref:hypothetical protein n=1 Tax=Vibrio fluvialis TaxID=676 RepID=UPI00192C9D2A|nr:hypothetical protein [Vibrio fluvialis]MBL4243241.1 hypothetical protein [Vibrio fluvialis]MBL4252075.1 hypothetical protein [Vibrio fluvialis]MBY7839196.1 hypothetical protein [Vibrio fluvialis]MBY7869881.1 hypothetical protein [Vibrio fluvialis]MBY8022114.1 hypothetical protein [Vibrio fluvialis]
MKREERKKRCGAALLGNAEKGIHITIGKQHLMFTPLVNHLATQNGGIPCCDHIHS